MFVVSRQSIHLPWHYTETPTWKAVFLGWTNRVSGEPIGFAGNAERALGTPRGDRKYAQSSDATGDRSATLCIRRGKERMARMCSGTPHPGCPVEASPAPGVFVDSRRESKDRIGVPTPPPPPLCQKVREMVKTKQPSAKNSEKRVKERGNY